VEKAKVVVEVRQYWSIGVGGVPMLYFSQFSPEGECQEIALYADSVEPSTHLTSAAWIHTLPLIPWSRGRLATRDTMNYNFNPDATGLVKNEILRIDSALKAMHEEDGELRYYMRVHNVQDEGYNMIADYKRDHDRREHLLQRTRQQLLGIGSGEKVSIRRISSYTALYNNKEEIDILTEGIRRVSRMF
jgi:lysozyme